MEKLVKNVMFFLILAVLAGCKTREKQVQKSETQSEYKSEATARIEEKTLKSFKIRSCQFLTSQIFPKILKLKKNKQKKFKS